LSKNWILILFGLSGMAALIYEITWIRPLSLVFGTTIYAVSTIIASFIFGLAVGSWLAGRFSDRLKFPLKYFAFIQFGIGVYGLFLLPIFSFLPGTYLELYKLTFPNQPLFILTQFLMAFGLISIPATLMGTTLPILMKSYSEKFSAIGKDVGKLDASNSMGAMFGTLFAGFLMIPLLGIQNTIIITALINTGIGASVLLSKKYVKIQYVAIVIVVLIPIFLFVPIYDHQLMNYGMFFEKDTKLEMQEVMEYIEKEEILFYKESMYSTIMVLDDGNIRMISINSRVQCDTSKATVKGLHQLASIPFELFEYNYDKPKNALNVGLGCGITTKWLSDKTETTTVEIDPVIVEGSKLIVGELNTNLIIDDARNWLLRNEVQFDIIATEPSDPFTNQGTLFTQEFFSLLKSKLTDNGLLSQWVPVYEMTLYDLQVFYNTFHSVFPYVYIYQMEESYDAQLVFIGSQKKLDLNQSDLYVTSYEKLPDVITILNTDDKPSIEFSSGMNIYDLYKDNEKIKKWLRTDKNNSTQSSSENLS